MKFIDDRYEEIFLKDNYLLATRYNTTYDEYASWGVLSVKDRRVSLNELYNSLNSEYSINGNNRIYAFMSNKLDLFNTSI